jgi:hypothetical protein
MAGCRVSTLSALAPAELDGIHCSRGLWNAPPPRDAAVVRAAGTLAFDWSIPMQTIAIACAAVALSATAAAQISFIGRPQVVSWPADCSTPVTFKNDTGVDLCDMWFSIGLDEHEDHPEIRQMIVQGGGNAWHVDDNEDGDIADANEGDDIDESADIGSTPPSPGHGWHRAQAAGSGDCIAPGATFTITLCDVQLQSLQPRAIALVGTTESGAPLDHGGDHGYVIGDEPRHLSQAAPTASAELQSSPRPPMLARESFLVLNDGFMPLPRIQLVPNDPDFDVIDVHSNVPINFTLSNNVINFTPPLQPSASAQLWIDLDQFSAQGATTDMTLVAMGIPPVPYCSSKQNSQGCFPMMFSNGAPSVSSSQPFMVMCQQVINQKQGLLFYGFGPKNAPFQGGTMCVQGPTKRTQIQNSAGAPPPDNCSGFFAYDFNARIDGGVDPLLAAGREVFAQWWYRDPQSPSTTGLSNGLHFVIDL